MHGVAFFLLLWNWGKWIEKKAHFDLPSGLKLTSFSSYECIHLHGYSNLFKNWRKKPKRNWKTVGSRRVSIFVLVVKVKGSAHPLVGWLCRVLSWLDILTPLALDRWILCTALYGGNWFVPCRSLRRPVSSSACLDIGRLPLGLISSGGAEAAGHSISTLCMLSVPASPFFYFFFPPKAKQTTSAAHLPGGNESQTTPGRFPEALLWLCSRATGKKNCLLSKLTWNLMLNNVALSLFLFLLFGILRLFVVSLVIMFWNVTRCDN